MTPGSFSSLLPSLCLVLLLSACNEQSPNPQTVVIDLAKALEATGLSERITQQAEAIREKHKEEMKALSFELGKQLDAEKTRYGENPGDDELAKIQTLRGQLRRQVMQARLEGNARVMKARTDARKAFIEEIMPLAQAVARERGASIILRSTPVLWSDAGIDITPLVVSRYLATGTGTPSPQGE